MTDKETRKIIADLERIKAAKRMSKKTGVCFRACLNMGDRVLGAHGLNIKAIEV